MEEAKKLEAYSAYDKTKQKSKMKKILSILAFMALTMGVQAQTVDSTSSPTQEHEVESLEDQIIECYNNNDCWQMEQLCTNHADSIDVGVLAFARGYMALRFWQLEEAQKQLELCVNEYAEKLDDDVLYSAVIKLCKCLSMLEEHDKAAKLTAKYIKYFSEFEDCTNEVERLKDEYERSQEFAKYPKMTVEKVSGDIAIPFHIDSIGATDESAQMYIDGKIQGKSECMMFDTGCCQNFINNSLARELHLTPINVSMEGNAGGSFTGTYVMADSVQFGGMTFRNVKFVLNSAGAEEDNQSKFRMIIGMPIIQQMRQFTMDFEHQVITIPSNPKDYAVRNIALDANEVGHIHIHITHNGKPVDMLVDTGNAVYSFLDYTFYNEHAEEVDTIKTKHQIILSGAAGKKIRLNAVLMRDFKFMLNGHEYSIPEVTVTKKKHDDITMLIHNNMGLRFMSSFKRVTISLKDAHIEFE